MVALVVLCTFFNRELLIAWFMIYLLMLRTFMRTKPRCNKAEVPYHDDVWWKGNQSGRRGQPQRGLARGIAPTLRDCRGNPLWLPLMTHFEAVCVTWVINRWSGMFLEQLPRCFFERVWGMLERLVVVLVTSRVLPIWDKHRRWVYACYTFLCWIRTVAITLLREVNLSCNKLNLWKNGQDNIRFICSY